MGRRSLCAHQRFQGVVVLQEHLARGVRPLVVAEQRGDEDRLRVGDPSRQHLVDDAAMHVGQAVVAAGVTIGESFVIEAHQVQDCGVEVVNVDRIFADVDAVLV